MKSVGQLALKQHLAGQFSASSEEKVMGVYSQPTNTGQLSGNFDQLKLTRKPVQSVQHHLLPVVSCSVHAQRLLCSIFPFKIHGGKAIGITKNHDSPLANFSCQCLRISHALCSHPSGVVTILSRIGESKNVGESFT